MRRIGARRIGWSGLLAITLGIAGAAPALAAPPVVPALVEPASQEHHVGKIVFAELVTPDLDAAKRFYGGLFGWTFRDTQFGRTRYSEAYLDDAPVAGMIEKAISPGEHRQPAWLTFMAVRDVDAAETVARQHGAKVLFAPRDVPDLGREAVLADPQGAIFAVVASSSGDPPDFLAAPGAWIWGSLVTGDPDTAAAFYQDVFDYEVFEAPTDDSGLHLMLASDNYARASANPLPVNSPSSYPHWLDYLRVVDAADAAAKVVALGGRVLVEPRIDRHGGKIAVAVDPQGAAFGLLEWPDAPELNTPALNTTDTKAPK